MANRSGSKGLLHGRLKLLAVTAVVVAGLTAFAVWLLLGFGVFTLHREISVLSGAIFYPDKLLLVTDGHCRGGPADIDAAGNGCRCAGQGDCPLPTDSHEWPGLRAQC